ncbi:MULTISPECIES: rRNA maturation RNase YbeY [unclassified Arthrobacter]|uniref:rRNA maturation RNase YbeY n=1 Tax=unclassified Arthrobacter TaxID=235627 RepID=UPI001D141002|nr:MULTISPECIES: rRNA maturation RNase YbeY [unclassified Arthrobacter]MCC3274827.1 rRNA maturation RNase YbeY [Arthrobacter sp. zg-Y20]MCC3279203.1 rRNA maturation RNase YbeY [Arthrobacter sp. zg-Y40]MCC9177579.1 rRNA maturation RNase YbeY [Arthrobacter sp. zg-Y750]MDK1314983.1 rRNA maturation RNase YbeY [Arthrobacter sp. zg.Y20]MDK1327845.1 rRNA maturation RNase YbeY [Arthrobacter sp. zg-Y1143]
MSIEVNNESSAPGVDEEGLARLGRYLLDSLYVHPEADLSIILVDEDAIEKLHIEWMDLPGPTDVLSFPMDELRPGTAGRITPAGVLGDIVLCPQVAARQAADAGHGTDEELLLLTTHGVLHLLGYDHAEPEEEKEMFGLQRRLLSAYLGKQAPKETRS